MEDNELIMQAAKAAGIDLFITKTGRPQYRHESGQYFIDWNPIKYDRDAFRLAVKLQLTVCNEHLSAGVVYCMSAQGAYYPPVKSGENEDEVIEEDYASTRLAIVHAAAYISQLPF